MIKKIIKGVVWALVIGLVVFILWPPEKYEPYQVTPEYQAQIDAFYIPPMPNGWKYEKYVTRDFVKIRIGKGPVNPNAKATLILMPGFTGLLDQYGEQLSHWQSKGFNVAGIDIRGQGGSDRPLKFNPEKSWVNDFSVYAEDIAEILDAEFSDTNAPIVMIGQSFGAHVAYRTVAAHDTDVAGLLLTVPAFRPNTGETPYGAAKFLYRLSQMTGKTDRYAPGASNWRPDVQDLTQKIPCSSEPKRIYLRDAMYVKDPSLRMGSATYQWFGQLMLSGEKMITPEWSSKIDVPVTMLLAENDTIVINDPAIEVCNDIGSCEYKIIEASGHCVLQENDQILQQVYDSVDQLVAKLGSSTAVLPAAQ